MKRFKAFLLALVLCVATCYMGTADVRAEDTTQQEVLGEDVELSVNLAKDNLIGYATMQTKGVYLLDGYSFINDSGNNRIGCGGTTTAAVKCKVSVNSIIERKVNGSWIRVTSWTDTNTYAYSADLSKSVSVSSGYYYRCRSVHSASTDTSSSCTDALRM